MDIKENFKGHLSTINHHKMEVMRLCFKVGLYKQGLMHDLSKYSPKEFISGVVFYTGDKSPNTTERRVTGKSEAWLHHKGRNKHHFEYWIDYGIREEDGLMGMRMPTKYVVEMFVDRMCASKNYLKEKYKDSSSLEYYEERKDNYLIHPESRRLLEELLKMLAENGEDKTLQYIKKKILHKQIPR